MTATNPPPTRRIHAIVGWRRLLLWPLGLIVRWWCRSLRWDASPETRALIGRKTGGSIFTLWHNRLFVTAEISRRFREGRPLYALVSASKDGAWLAAFFEVVGMRTVRGSSSRFGREALHTLAERLREGKDIGITPDGPRGPCYELKGGSVILARKTGATTVLVGMRFANAWRLGSWDRFYLPCPFSRVHLIAEEWPAERLESVEDPVGTLQTALRRLNPDN